MPYDLLIRNGTVVSTTSERELDVAVEGERIVAVEPPGALGTEARTVIDASGCLVIPGGVDPHCHYAMNFENILVTETQDHSWAAAWGGTTTVIDFAFCDPPSTLLEAIQAKKDEAAGRMAVDYSFHPILTKDISFENIEQIGDAIRQGLPTIKTFMTYAYMCDDGQRYGVMLEVARQGGMSVVHAEDDAIANWLAAKYIREGKTHGAYISEVRGPLVEEAATRRALLLAERAGSPLYVLHMAAGSAVEALAEGRAKGLPFYGETLPTYLSFTQDELWDESELVLDDGTRYPRRGLLFNNYTTIKTAADRATLWAAIADGRLQAVGTDHALVTVKDRYEVLGIELPFVQAGQASVELRVPLLYSGGVAAGRISVNRFVELASANPAKITGLWPRKGQIAAGADADIVILDPRKRWTVDWRENLHMTAPYSLWQGSELTGKVRTTILRGSLLVEDERWVGSKTGGRFQERKLLPEVVGSSPDFDFTFQAQPAAVAH